jgi:hypothetical protein
MDPVTALWNPGTLVVAMICVIGTFFVRQIVETAAPQLKKVSDENDLTKATYNSALARWWNKVILYALPVLIGGGCGYVPSEWLFPSIDTVGARVMVGLVIGWFSTFVYKIIRRLIKQKTGVDIPSGPPPAASPSDPPGAA